MKLYDEKTHEEVALPAERKTFRGDTVRVERIEMDASPGRSGKVLCDGRTFYPGVVGCYIADQPREP